MIDRRSAPRARQAGRAILRDAAGRVLLIHFVLPNMTFWATPGGGGGGRAGPPPGRRAGPRARTRTTTRSRGTTTS
jgi:hypothetical protein